MKKRHQDWFRRKFIIGVTGSGTAFMFKPVWSLADNQIDPGIADIVTRTIGIDTHNHIDVPLDTDQLFGPELDLSGEMKKSGLSAIVMTFAQQNVRMNF